MIYLIDKGTLMKKILLRRTVLTAFILGLYMSPAVAFEPDKYSYQVYPVSVDGTDMVVLRAYDIGQEIKFTEKDVGSDFTEKVLRNFNEQDLMNVQGSMRYVKDVFGVPSEAPFIEVMTNTEFNASFGSPVSEVSEVEDEGVISGTRLSTWFIGDDKNTQLPVGFLTIGEMGDKDGDTLYSLVRRGEGAAMSSVIVHEMMHGMGISTLIGTVEDEDTGEEADCSAQDNTIFSNNLYDIYGQQLNPGMVFQKVTADSDVDEPSDEFFYQYDNEANSGAYFLGDHVKEVLTIDGITTKIAFSDGDEVEDFHVSSVPGIPINGFEEDETGEDSAELSHLELQNSMMSHQNYRNWGTFMEAELAVLQDIGFSNIDRRKFFGFSVYNNLMDYTNNNGFNSDQDFGIGLHIYGSYNTITQGADIETRGNAAYGVRIEGKSNDLIVPENVKIQAKGVGNIGVLVSYGNNHTLNIQGDVKATGKDSDALRFDFGGNLLGDNLEYRGSYFQVYKDTKTGQWKDMADGITAALYGPLARQVDISGDVVGNHSAIYISDNALVEKINILNGAEISGDIISEWSPAGNRYGNYGEGMTLYKPEDEADRTLLTFGFEADEEGKATAYADENFEMEYAGNITGSDGFDVQLAGGKLTYGGDADVNMLQTEEDTELVLADSNVVVSGFSAEGKVAASGTSNIALRGEDGTAQFSDLTVNEGANVTVNAGAGTVEIDDLQNSGKAEFTSDKIQQEQITVDKYTGTDDSVLALNLGSQIANQMQNGSAEQLVQQGSQILVINDNTTDSNVNLHIAEGEINGEINAVVNSDGRTVAVSERKNTATESLQEIASNEFQVFRAQMNDMEKRMGDLRNMPGESGAWGKFITGQSKYKGLHNDYDTFQFGIDHRFGDFFAGVMGSRTDGDGKLKTGSTDDKNYSYGLYGGWLGKDGQFVDVTMKHHQMKSKYGFNANGNYSKGHYDMSGNSASIEYGWRLGIYQTNFYVEPQAEFLYGYLDGTDYVTNRGVRVEQSDIKSVVGRLGVATGWVAPDKRGNVYIRASVLNDWQGDSKIRVSNGVASRQYREDMGGTWGEFALGGTLNVNKSLSIYGEMETTTGSPVRTTYEFDAGLRLNF